MKRMFRGPKYANVTATIALVVALGGTSYAAATLPKNSVGSKQLKSNAVSSSKVKNGSLLAKDFKASDLPKGPKGDKGDAGAAGAPGAPGTPGAKGDTGNPGPLVDTLPVGSSLRGTFALGGTAAAANALAFTSISFQFPLATAPTVHVIPVGGVVPAGCSGTPAAPVASSGNLCIFDAFSEGAPQSTSFFGPLNGVAGGEERGLTVFIRSSAAGTFDRSGTWAVTG
jgi:hypothetical protein